jgi:hypothetical protein
MAQLLGYRRADRFRKGAGIMRDQHADAVTDNQASCQRAPFRQIPPAQPFRSCAGDPQACPSVNFRRSVRRIYAPVARPSSRNTFRFDCHERRFGAHARGANILLKVRTMHIETALVDIFVQCAASATVNLRNH